MKTRLKNLYDCFYTPPEFSEQKQEVEECHQTLIKVLEKPERRLVLRIMDAQNLMAEERSIWKQVQQRLKEQARPANGNRSKHRYAGLLRCQECGNVFVPMIRHWNGKRRVEYVCKGYHRSGKSYCSSHRIHEENLDTMVWEYFTAVRDNRVKEREKLVKLQKMWALRKPVLDAHILLLQKKVHELEREIDEILMDRIMK